MQHANKMEHEAQTQGEKKKKLLETDAKWALMLDLSDSNFK